MRTTACARVSSVVSWEAVATAFINMPGVFTILAADHLSPAHWKDFMHHCLTWFKGIPGLPSHALVADVIPRERLAAWAWYEV